MIVLTKKIMSFNQQIKNLHILLSNILKLLVVCHIFLEKLILKLKKFTIKTLNNFYNPKINLTPH
jgi:hypothetical protein